MPHLRNGSPFPMRKDVQLVLTASTAFTPASTSAPAIPSPMAARTTPNEGDFFANVLHLAVTRFTWPQPLLQQQTFALEKPTFRGPSPAPVLGETEVADEPLEALIASESE